jgi:hypothetical protein
MNLPVLQAGLGRLTDLDALVGPYGLVEKTLRLPNHSGDTDSGQLVLQRQLGDVCGSGSLMVRGWGRLG